MLSALSAKTVFRCWNDDLVKTIHTKLDRNCPSISRYEFEYMIQSRLGHSNMPYAPFCTEWAAPPSLSPTSVGD